MNNIFFDFDGTIIDNRVRLYNLFTELTNQSILSFDQYWAIKRNKVTQKEILQKFLAYSDDDCKIFKQNWLEGIEDPLRLKQDCLIVGIVELLQKFSVDEKLVIVTNRQFEDRVIEQIEDLGIKNFFYDILVTKQQASKFDLITKFGFKNSDSMIGDTDEDILTAKQLGICSIAVNWGGMGKEILVKCKPDAIVDTISQLNFILESKGK